MRFTSLTLLAALATAPASAKVYFKEQFNDDVSGWLSVKNKRGNGWSVGIAWLGEGTLWCIGKEN